MLGHATAPFKARLWLPAPSVKARSSEGPRSRTACPLASPPLLRVIFLLHTVFFTLRYDSRTIPQEYNSVVWGIFTRLCNHRCRLIPVSCGLPLLPSSHTGPFAESPGVFLHQGLLMCSVWGALPPVSPWLTPSGLCLNLVVFGRSSLTTPPLPV